MKLFVATLVSTTAAHSAALNAIRCLFTRTVRAIGRSRWHGSQRHFAGGAEKPRTPRIALMAVCAVGCVIYASASAQQTGTETRRFPRPHITKLQWQAFFVETRSKPGAVIVDRANSSV